MMLGTRRVQVWEYRTLETNKSDETKLSQLGGQGWNLLLSSKETSIRQFAI